MCWLSAKAIQKIAEKDFYVYKIGRVPWDDIFISDIKSFEYIPKSRNKIVSLIVQSPCMGTYIIQEGYHSYKWIAIDNINPNERCLCLGNYDPSLKENLSLYKHYCIGTFIVPKGAEYYESEFGGIVSSDIIYTGRYLKLQTMCWIENIKKLDLQIADRNIEVYKIVSDASKQFCKSIFQEFVYKTNIKYEMDAMELEKSSFNSDFCTTDLICIMKAYHSYTKIRFTLKKPYDPYSKHGYKGIIAGNLLMPIRIDNPYYVATFVIPKGSQYAVNWKGEIVSNQIMYTGKHLKL